MDNQKTRKVIIMSLAGLLIGSLLFIFGISLQGNLWPLITNYLIAMAMYVCSFLAVYNNNRQDPQPIYKYIMVLSVFIGLIVTITALSNIL
ncbi:MAG: hypothetical protein UFX20_12750 [Longibaculum muris]|uniref:Uncharacterized protein n=1 Tax=Longibaculum muris TaxID=1796628 RepID=A0A4V2W3D6_9FIRM|nr:hypothetical protein [Longibaculum muris]KXU41875.1 hypothetical protein HMPREF3037_02975 [Candidatus Stoquefichus sp. KLE1796]MBS5368255.1 hypothetical protein [Coprobacillus cateniformis]MCR1889294.1 hypothetical protein [Longibaculum muris]MED9812958.1 hypothetical protein [Longibaculum muris]TCV91539.1 hypothetical protein EDD60_13134 [Longibaculum muris]